MPDTPLTSSPALSRFRAAFFGPIDQYLAWHDGYEADTTALDALQPVERAVAEQELLTALQARQADMRAVIGLGHLRSRAALPVLHDFLPTSGTYALPAIAQIDPQSLDSVQLNALLRSDLSEFHLLDLLIGLRLGFTLAQLPPAIPATVLHLLTHQAYLVRYHALDTLRALYRLPKPPENQPRVDHIFSLICTDKSTSEQREAQRLIREQIRQRGYTI